MNEKKYNDIISELNFYDFSINKFPITLYDEKEIVNLLKEFDCIPIGLKYKKRKDMYYKFKYGIINYKIVEFENKLIIFKI